MNDSRARHGPQRRQQPLPGDRRQLEAGLADRAWTAFALEPAITARPRAPYTKFVIINVISKHGQATSLSLPMFVKGDWTISETSYVDLPEYLPVFILHDPPGGHARAND